MNSHQVTTLGHEADWIPVALDVDVGWLIMQQCHIQKQM